MDPIDLWIEALESGEYAQGRCRLQNGDNTFCCLGVACEVYQKHVGNLIIEKVIEDRDASLTYFTYDGAHNTLPNRVQKWLGLASSDGNYGSGMTTLWRLNDQKAMSFKVIAQVIRENREALTNGN